MRKNDERKERTSLPYLGRVDYYQEKVLLGQSRVTVDCHSATLQVDSALHIIINVTMCH